MTTDTDTARISPADIAIGELLAFPPAALVPGRARSNLDATITKEWTAQLAEHAKTTSRTYRSAYEPSLFVKCGNHTPVTVVRFGPASCGDLGTAGDREPHTRPDQDCEDCWPDGGFEVVTGDRRTLGCLSAGTYVLGYVAGEKDDSRATRRALLLDRLTENRSRVGPLRRDEAQLVLDLGGVEKMSAAAIARATGLGKGDVEAMQRAAQSELGAALLDKYAFLSFDQAAALDEFNAPEHAETVKALVAAAQVSPSKFEHVLAQARQNKETLAARGRFTAELEAAGVRVYGDSHRGVPYQMRLSNLRTADGEEITPEAHAECPDHAVTIRYDYAWRDDQAEAAWREANDLAEDDDIEFGDDAGLAEEAGFVLRWQVDDYLCTDPDEQGHVNQYGARAATPTPAQQSAEEAEAKRAAASAERRRVIANNKAWDAATEVRAAHIKKVLAAFGSSKTLPAAMKDLPAAYELLDAEARARREPDAGFEGHKIPCDLLGIKLQYASQAGEAILAELAQARGKRIRVLNLAMLLGGYEQGTRKRDLWRDAESSSFRWRGENPAPARHLLWLEANTGYDLSALEYFAAHGTHRVDWTVERPGALPGDQGEWAGRPDRLIGVACGHFAADPRPFTTAEQVPCHGPGCNGEWREITSVITPGGGGQPARDLATEEDLGDDEHGWDDDGPDDGPARQDVPGPDGLGPGGPDEINPAAVDRGGGLGNDGGGGDTAA